MSEELSDAARAGLLAGLSAWRYDPDRKAIHRRIRFHDFGEALAAMVRIGLEAEKANHHPEWCNVYDRLDVWLTTHDASGVTMRDIELARNVDLIVADRPAP